MTSWHIIHLTYNNTHRYNIHSLVQYMHIGTYMYAQILSLITMQITYIYIYILHKSCVQLHDMEDTVE